VDDTPPNQPPGGFDPPKRDPGPANAKDLVNTNPAFEGSTVDGPKVTLPDDVELTEDLKVPEGVSIDVPTGKTLTVPDGTVLSFDSDSKIEGEGTVDLTNGKVDVTTLTRDSVGDNVTIKATEQTVAAETTASYKIAPLGKTPVIVAADADMKQAAIVLPPAETAVLSDVTIADAINALIDANEDNYSNFLYETNSDWSANRDDSSQPAGFHFVVTDEIKGTVTIPSIDGIEEAAVGGYTTVEAVKERVPVYFMGVSGDTNAVVEVAPGGYLYMPFGNPGDTDASGGSKSDEFKDIGKGENDFSGIIRVRKNAILTDNGTAGYSAGSSGCYWLDYGSITYLMDSTAGDAAYIYPKEWENGTRDGMYWLSEEDENTALAGRPVYTGASKEDIASGFVDNSGRPHSFIWVANGNILLYGSVVNDQGIYMSANILLSPGAHLTIDQKGTGEGSPGAFPTSNSRGFNWMGNSVSQYAGSTDFTTASNKLAAYNALALGTGGSLPPARITLKSGVMLSVNLLSGQTTPNDHVGGGDTPLADILSIGEIEGHSFTLKNDQGLGSYSSAPVYVAGDGVLGTNILNNGSSYTDDSKNIVWTWTGNTPKWSVALEGDDE
jgi:hypothetical protein